jgi:hypothetical protein
VEEGLRGAGSAEVEEGWRGAGNAEMEDGLRREGEREERRRRATRELSPQPPDTSINMLRASVISYALQKRKRKRKNIVCFSSFHYHRFLHLIIIVFFIHFDSVFREQVRSCLIETRSRGYHQLCLLFSHAEWASAA